MKQGDDKWIRALRDRVNNYSEQVPDDVWSFLEKDLDISPKAKVYPFRRWTIVAASVVLAIISSMGLYLLFLPADEYMKNITETISIDKRVDIVPKDVEPDAIIVADKSESTMSARRIAQVKKMIIENNHIETEENIISDSSISEPEKTETIKITESEKEPALTENIQERKNKLTHTPETDYQWDRLTKKTKTKNWSVNVSVGNNMANSSTTTPGFDMLFNTSSLQIMTPSNSPDLVLNNDFLEVANAPVSQARKQVFLNTLNEPVESEKKHKTPVSFGLSGRYAFSEKFAVETGLIYTMLSSEVKSGAGTNYSIDEIKLHYMGIPLKGSYTFFNKKRFLLYVSAGGTVEKCISGKQSSEFYNNGNRQPDEKEDIDIDELQWSISAALGAQLNITNHFGFYIEPGVVHYFDDGSSVETIRKNKPTNFNLQLGLRLTY